ncbi:MAG: septal ring lytic transglycosylase RlpA family protein [Gammaproteobacteria bacterium]|nr:septal ring lytic transglycosylase RlpA family protein [Gammaproteobacteria bacterium]
MLGFRDGPPRHPRGFDIANIENAQPRPEPLSKYGNPDSYTVNGVRYEVLESAADYRATGKASWYGSKFHGKRTSSGEPYDAFAMTAAHKTLPIPSYVRVRNLENDKEIVVKVNDRGPFHPERVIDLSYAAAMKLGVYAKGTAEVEVLAIDPTGSGVWPSRSASREDFIKPLFVQIGAYSAQENAERVQYELKKSDIQSGIYVASSLNGHGKVFRVRVGPFTDRQDADRVARDLLTMGIPEAKIVSD